MAVISRAGADSSASAPKLDELTESQRQAALLKTGALQNAILTSPKFSIIATDEKGIIQLFNVGAERMLGYAAAEVVDKISPSDIHDPQELEARARALSAELGVAIASDFEALAFKASRGVADSYDLTCICKDGSRFPAIVSITALCDDYGAIIGYLLIGTDNSVRKQAEAALTSAKAAAEKANLAKTDFLSNMSHELRSPLNAILGFAQLMELENPPQTASQMESTSQILQAGWYLLDLINEILDLSLIESGRLLLSQEPMSLNDVMLDCEAMIEPQARKYGITVTFNHFESARFVHADRTRVKQVLINLLVNAIKYNHAGGTVVVDYEVLSAERVRVSITDSGPGLSADKLAQLFQPFNRLGQETSGEEGTGIGLVTTKRLVELMSGSIGVESTVGKGSVFWFELLRAEEPALADADQELVTQGGESFHKDPAQQTLLYVEDNPANMRLVEKLVARRPNVRLLGAGDATLGIALAREWQPEVILMDINLPGISGIRALKLLSEDPLTQHIPVIALSANAMPHDIDRGMEAGFFRYLTKPIRVKEFMDTLDDAMQVSRTISAARKTLDTTGKRGHA